MLKMIRGFAEAFGYPPTVRQIGRSVGISSTSVVSYNLGVLQRKGYLTRDREISRGLRLIDEEPDKTVQAESTMESMPLPGVPLLGFIAAGEPIPIPDSDFWRSTFERIAVSADIVKNPEEVYALQVRGTSMIDALIGDGDIVIMHHQQNAENGDMIAAWLKDEKATTLKRIYWEKDRPLIRLQPANPTMEPIYVHPSNLEIQGKVIAVIRRLS
jgi:repressor LexA